MSPSFIIKQALKSGLKLISITDHNAIKHSLLACQISKKEDIKVLPGVELTSREEVHILAYFDDLLALLKLGELVERLLPDLENKPEYFGHQVIYDNANEIVDLDNRLRQLAIDISLDKLVEEIHKLKGIAIPAHIDKNKFSLISQLGFIDENAAFDALEVSKFKWNKGRYQLGDTLSGFPVVCGSDSHSPDDIGLFYMETCFDEFADFDFLKNFLQERKK
jgi:3',5'-nucleoside bisphosphate phosphatase